MQVYGGNLGEQALPKSLRKIVRCDDNCCVLPHERTDGTAGARSLAHLRRVALALHGRPHAGGDVHVLGGGCRAGLGCGARHADTVRTCTACLRSTRDLGRSQDEGRTGERGNAGHGQTWLSSLSWGRVPSRRHSLTHAPTVDEYVHEGHQVRVLQRRPLARDGGDVAQPQQPPAGGPRLQPSHHGLGPTGGGVMRDGGMGTETRAMMGRLPKMPPVYNTGRTTPAYC